MDRKGRRRGSKAQSRARGFSLIEAVISMGIFAVALLGLAASHLTAAKADGQALRVSQATSIAQAVGHFLQTVPWSSPLLADRIIDNNLDPDDANMELAKQNDPSVLPDHQLQLPNGVQRVTASQKAIEGVPADLDFNRDGKPDFEVFWNVVDCAVNGNTNPWTISCLSEDNPSVPAESLSFKQIGVIVRWLGPGGKWYRIATQIHRHNPGLQGL